jgi:hypothetical protein
MGDFHRMQIAQGTQQLLNNGLYNRLTVLSGFSEVCENGATLAVFSDEIVAVVEVVHLE